MGGKRIAEQVRRALILAAKTAPVVVAIDSTGCVVSNDTCASVNPYSPRCPAGPAKLVPAPLDAGQLANLSDCPTSDPGFDKQRGGYWDTGFGAAYQGAPECSPCASDCISYGFCLAGGVASRWVQCTESCTQ